MPFRRIAPLLLALSLTACAHTASIGTPDTDARHWAHASQLVLVTSADWNATGGELRRFEREGNGWKQVGDAVPVTLGRNGSGWGLGLNPQRGDGPVKREGDGKAPAGCTAMAPDAMAPLLAWLDARRQPVFVTLPRAQYEALKGAWRLPDIDRAEATR